LIRIVVDERSVARKGEDGYAADPIMDCFRMCGESGNLPVNEML
jgi:hypothetical protein